MVRFTSKDAKHSHLNVPTAQKVPAKEEENRNE